MAKRTTPRAQADESADRNTVQPAQPKPRRSRSKPAEPQAHARATASASELPEIPEPGDMADQAARVEANTIQPSDEEIRLRAYHRYLERGAGHGAHFEDWLEAERELREKSGKSEI
jgi:hypothetical protein